MPFKWWAGWLRRRNWQMRQEKQRWTGALLPCQEGLAASARARSKRHYTTCSCCTCSSILCVYTLKYVWEALWMSVKNVSSGIHHTVHQLFKKVNPTVLHINPNHIYIQVPRTQDRKTRLASLSQRVVSQVRMAPVGTPRASVHTQLWSFMSLYLLFYTYIHAF